MEEPNNFQTKIQKIWDEINKFLIPYENELLLLDYTYIIDKEVGFTDIKSYYIYAIKNYPSLLNEFLEREGNAFSDADDVTLTANFDNITVPRKVKYDEYAAHQQTLKKTKIENWHNFLKEKKIGGAAITTYHRLPHKAHFGVYVILKSPISEQVENLEGCNQNFVDLLMGPITKFLLKFGLDKLYSDYAQIIHEKEMLQIFKAQILDHQHTINNLFPKLTIKNAIEEIEKGEINNAMIYLNKSLTQLDLLYLLLSTDFNKAKNHSLHGKNISQFIEYIKDTSNSSTIPVIENLLTDEYEKFNFIIEDSLAREVFLIFVNLWDNAKKRYEHSSDERVEFWVRLYVDNGCLKVSFKNFGLMNSEFIKYLESKHELPLGKGRGLKIIKENVQKLNWELGTRLLLDEHKTEIILTIKR